MVEADMKKVFGFGPTNVVTESVFNGFGCHMGE
jgi:hypothetical protein